MKLLLDENLSFRIIHQIEDLYPGSAHVKDFGLIRDDDAAIWSFAATHNFTIVSKDEDFHQLSLLCGHPPRFIFLKVGNCPTSTIVSLLRNSYNTVREFHNRQSESLLILPFPTIQ